MSKDFSALSGFSRRDGALYCEELNLRELAQRFGTPLYVYSHQALKTALENWMRGIAGTNHRVFYAMKANSNLALLKFFHDSGTGFDIVSRGELQRALMAGAKGNDIVYSGVGKSREDIRAALRADIGCFNVESIPELEVQYPDAAFALMISGNLFVGDREQNEIHQKAYTAILNGESITGVRFKYDYDLESYLLKHMWD